MGTYTGWEDGYLLETTYGTSLIANTNTQTNSLGILAEDAIHPSPQTDILYTPTGGSRQSADGGVWKGAERLRGSYVVVPQNGVLLYLVMGASSTAAAVHTITPTTGRLPSVTIQHDLTGTASDWGTQYKGTQIQRLELSCNYDTRYLWANVDWVAQAASNAGFVSTNTPVLPTTATTAPYTFKSMTFTYDGDSYRDNLTEVSFVIDPDLHLWNDGTRTMPQPIEGDRVKYQLRFKHNPPSSTFWDDLVSTGNNKDAVLKWAKSTDDYIQINMTELHIAHHEQRSPTVNNELIEEVICEPREVSIAVKDTVTDSYYGE